MNKILNKTPQILGLQLVPAYRNKLIDTNQEFAAAGAKLCFELNFPHGISLKVHKEVIQIIRQVNEGNETLI